jgi:hypothetical protein
MIDTNSVEICYTFIYCLSFIHLFCKFIIKSIIFNSEFAHFLYSDGQKIGGKKKKKKKRRIIRRKLNAVTVVLNVKQKLKLYLFLATTATFSNFFAAVVVVLSLLVTLPLPPLPASSLLSL